MSEVLPHREVPRLRPARLAEGAVVGATVLAAAALAVAVGATPVPLAYVLGGGLALVGLLALATLRYDAAIALGLLVFGVVFIEPAPPDLVFSVVMAVAVATGRFALARVPSSVLTLAAALVLLNLLSVTSAIDLGRAGKYMGITLYLVIFAFWLTGYVESSRRARAVVTWLVVGAVASALAGTAAVVVGFPGADLLTLYEPPRAKALFKDPNVFGPFLVVPVLLLLSELVQPRLLSWRRPVVVACLGALGVGVLFAYSRAAWLNLAVAFVVLMAVSVVRRGGSRRASVLLVSTLALVCCVLATISLTGSGDFLRERARLQSYDTERFAGQEAGLRLAVSHPLGIGPGQFEDVVGIAAHSTYVRALGEQGAAGLVALVGVLITTLVLAVRNAIRGWDTFGIPSGVLLAAWCGILANSLFVDTLHWRHLWLVAALVWAGSTARRPVPAAAAR
jgi:O-antigen ligase